MAGKPLIPSLLRPFFRQGKTDPFCVPGILGEGARVLAIDSGDLTELLFHGPLLQGIHEKYPDCQIDFLLPEEHAELVVPSGLAKQCLVYREKQLRSWTPSFVGLLRSLRKNKYDMAILMSLNPHSQLELAMLASGAPLRYGPSHEGCYPAINFEIRPLDDPDRYLGLRPASAAAFLGLGGHLKRGWPLPPDRLRKIQQLVHFNKPRKDELLVGVDPGLGKEGFGISLPNLHFLVKQLSSQALCRFLPLADPANLDRLQRFESRLAGPPPGISRDTLLEMILLLSQCDLFLAGNTDLFHFAVAHEVPTLGLFTAQDPPKWEPREAVCARVLRITKGERVDIDTLMEAVEAVTGGLAPRTGQV